jgi:hypothetical protein
LRPTPGVDVRRLAAEVERAINELADEQVTDWWTARRRAAAGSTPSLTGPSAGAWRRNWALTAREHGDGRERDELRWPRP